MHSSLELLEPRIAPAVVIHLPDGSAGNTFSNGVSNPINNLNGIGINWLSPVFAFELASITAHVGPSIPPPGFDFNLIPHAISATGNQSLGSLSKPIAEASLRIANLGFLLDGATSSLGPSALRGSFSSPDSSLFYDVSGSSLAPSALDAGIWD